MSALAFVDTHSHLDRYPEPVLTAMLERAAAAGVERIITVGFDLDCAAAGLRIAQAHHTVRAALGVHPRAVPPEGLTSETLETLRQLAAADGAGLSPGLVAIGEIGLDSQAPAPAAVQEAAFVAQLRLARSLELPVNLHIWEWHAAAISLLRREGVGRGAIVHYFQGDWDLARAYLDLGCLISVGKPVTRPAATALRDAVRQAPLDALLLETDTYPLPGRTTEPCDVVSVAQAIAELRGLPIAAVAEATTANARRLLGE